MNINNEQQKKDNNDHQKKEEPKKIGPVVFPPAKESQKEEPKKINIFENKGKNIASNNPAFSSKPVPTTKPLSSIPEQPKPQKSFQASSTTTGNTKRTETSSKPSPAAGSFGSKLSQMNEMFKNKGLERNGAGGHRPSMMIGMPQNFKFGKGGPSSGSSGGGGKNSDIINEEPDKMKPGYDPAANLQKTLDSVVVVKKDKKKKKKPAFKG